MLILVLVLVGVGVRAGAGESPLAPPAPPSNLLFLPPVFSYSCFCSWPSPAPSAPSSPASALLFYLLLCFSLLLPLLLYFSPAPL